MRGFSVYRLAGVSLRLFVVMTMVLGLLASPVIRSSASVATAAETVIPGTPSVQAVTLDTSFAPLPRGETSPWDGEFVLDGIDGLSYNSPGAPVQVRAMSSNAGFVNEVWLVYPRVQYLFSSKDIADTGNEFRAMQFSDWITVGTFPPGTELIFGLKTNVGIDDKCQERLSDGAQHHCYAIEPDPSYIPLAPDPQRECALVDEACRNKAWPSLTPDGKTVFYTGPGVRNVRDDTPHGRFQYLDCAVVPVNGECPSGAKLTNTALFGMEDVGAPKAGCPGAVELQSLVILDDVVDSDLPQTIRLSSLDGLDVGDGVTVYQPFQRETVEIRGIDHVAGAITALFLNPDNGKTYPAGTNWSPVGCDWHPDFQDAGLVVFPALAATCQSTAQASVVEIVGQEGYGSVALRTAATAFSQLFRPGDRISFTTDLGAPESVSGASPAWTMNVHTTTSMAITDITKPLDDADRTLDAGICFDPQFPPLPIIETIEGTFACGSDWDFTISGVTAATAPPSIRVTFTNDQTPAADEAATIPLTNVDEFGVAHYTSTLHTSLQVVSATTTTPFATWSGTFKLESGPCGVLKTADLTLACAPPDATAWDFTITETTQAQAPAQIEVTWSNGATEQVPLGDVRDGDGNIVDPAERGTARYATSAHLDAQVALATATIQGQWDGGFKVNGIACPASRTLTLTEIPPCAEGATAWDFTLSGLTAAPESVLVTWSGLAPEAVGLSSFDSSSGLAHYATTAHTGDGYLPVTGVSAVIPFATQAESDAYAGVLAVPGVPCPPEAPTPPGTHVKKSTLTDHECVSGDEDDNDEDQQGEWHFVITKTGRASAPSEIFVSWASGATETVGVWKVTGSTAHYRTTSHLDEPVSDAVAATADGWSGQFNLSHGPCFSGGVILNPPGTTPPGTTPSPSPSPTPTPRTPCVDRSLSSSRSGGGSRGSGTGSSCSSGDDDDDPSGDAPDARLTDGVSDDGEGSPAPSASPAPSVGDDERSNDRGTRDDSDDSDDDDSDDDDNDDRRWWRRGPR